MIPWIQVYSNLATHRKTAQLADALGLTNSHVSPDIIAVGILVSLWTWAIQNASDGDLSKCSNRVIAEACRWKKKPEALINALREARWIDEDGKLHDWEEYASLLLVKEEERKAKTRERVQRYRDKKKENCNAECNVSDTPCNAPTIHNHTIHNHTVPNITSNNNSFYLSEEKKEEKKESGFGSLEYYMGMIRDAKERNVPYLMQMCIQRVKENFGVIVDPETLEVVSEQVQG